MDVSILRDAPPPDAQSMATRCYKPAWASMFVASLAYMSAVAFAPNYLPWRLGQDVEALPSDVVAVAQPVPAKAAQPEAKPPQVAVIVLPNPAQIEPVRPNVINARPNPSDKPIADAPGTTTVTAAAPIETGTLAKPAQPANGYGIQIGSAPSLDTLRLVWTRMIERHRPQLQGAEPRFVSSEANLYALVAGPFASEAEARRVCADLAARNDQCRVRTFSGDNLF